MALYHIKYPLNPSLNTQSCNRRPLCSTFTFENLRSPKKNPVLLKKKFKKNSKKKKIIIMQLFSADAIVFSKKF